jgi:hypothetical protein
VTESRDLASDLARTCPEVAADWAQTAEDLDTPYVALGHLGARLIAFDEADAQTDFGPLFAEVERLLVSGGPILRDQLIVGFLEGLQNQAGDSADRWRRLLGPETPTAWDVLYDVWAGRMTGRDFQRFIAR